MTSFAGRRIAALAAAGATVAGGTLGLAGVAAAAYPNADANIVFSSTRPNAASDTSGSNLWVVNPQAADGTATGDQAATSELTETAGDDDAAFFSADGSKVVFFSNRDGGTFNIWTVPATNRPTTAAQEDLGTTLPAAGTTDADGATLLFSDGTSDTWPSYSPSGTLVAYLAGSSTTAATSVRIYNTATATSTVVATGSIALSRPVFSPDGTKLVYTQLGPNQGEEHLVEVLNPGSAQQSTVDLSAVTDPNGTATDEHPDWSPDGTKLIFDTNRTTGCGSLQIYTVSVANPSTIAAFFGACTTHADFEPAYAPAGDKVTFVRTAAGSNVNTATTTTEMTASANGGNILNESLASTRSKNFEPDWAGVSSGPPATVPESPLAVALPAAGVALVGGSVALLRRRRRP